ncbi:dual oxidase 2-like isoform X2 [Anneissia japonica]|uniref:dual oxidase 2-like isoform X2 n=1 Tax=Anneissia japonica TaxID=1529436 RepID=UPI0014259157|nr:dual oxidase 2-like isoform X2 [Anneissia japonica]
MRLYFTTCVLIFLVNCTVLNNAQDTGTINSTGIMGTEAVSLSVSTTETSTIQQTETPETVLTSEGNRTRQTIPTRAMPTRVMPTRVRPTKGAEYNHSEEYLAEPEGYDGWYNNLAHPDWGGAEMALTRRIPPAYVDGVYYPSGEDRPNPFTISDNTMFGVTGSGSVLNRTAFMTFFGQQVVEEILDAQRPGCPPEYFNIPIPEGHRYTKYIPLKEMPFLRSRVDQNTGYNPNVPREQLNEITPWMDGGLVYGTTKAWADALRSFKDGKLAGGEFPEKNTIGLPMANPPPPAESADHKLRDVTRFFKLGNPRGDENPYLLTFGILWYRWHNYWADVIKSRNPDWNDEQIFNEARKWVIGTYQKIVWYEWLPAFLNMDEEEMNENAYDGYKPYIHPQISHIFQSAAMRFGHTLVVPGVARRNASCHFYTTTTHSSNTPEDYDPTGRYGVRTCNSFWNPQLPIEETGFESFLMGMASQLCEREDNIITEDLRGNVFGRLDFSRRDLMAINIQRARDHGLPDYNTARRAYGLKVRENFRDINPHCDSDKAAIKCEVLDRLNETYGGDISKVDIWPGGLLETTNNGPGELFRTVILDQFRRIRDGDRFWFENEIGGPFTEEERQEIWNITIFDVLINATNINEGDIQRDPFHFYEDDVCYEEALEAFDLTLSETELDNCTDPYTFDYFRGSQASFVLTFLAAGVWACGCVALLYILSRIRRKEINESRKAQRRKSRKSAKETTKLYATREWCGHGQAERPVAVRLGPGKTFVVLNDRGNKVYRTIDLTIHQKLTFLVCPDQRRKMMAVVIDKEYDLVLKFDTEEERNAFISDIESFLTDPAVGVGRERREVRQSEMLRMANTKVERQRTLERFFRVAFAQAFKLDIDPQDITELRSDIAKDVLTCELTKQEFAEALSMKPDSVFVDQMFDLVDKDDSGTVSFREFLDIIVIFAQGNPDDKLELMFNMYDVDHSGLLTREEFKKMLKSMMEVVSADLEPTQLEEVVQTMFKSAGFESKNELSLQDFNILMGEHKEELSNAALQIQGQDIKNVQPDVKSAPRGTVIRRENAPQRARKTIIKAYAKGNADSSTASHATSGGVKGGIKRRQTRTVEIDTVKQNYPNTQSEKLFGRIKRFIENERLKIFWFVLYTLVLGGIFAERAYYYSIEREFAGLRRIAGYGVTVTRGAASAMMFTFSSLLVTMCRNLITKLRETFLHRFIPFDSALAMHKIIALYALFFSVMHTIGHGINFYHISSQPPNDLTCLFRDFFHRSHVLPKFHYWCWQTITGFTGVLLVLLACVIYVFATQYARRNVFNLFWLTHNTYIIFYILMVLHGSGRLVQPPFFWFFFLGPAILFTLDKLVSISRKKAEISVFKAELLPSDVTGLVFKRPTNFEYKSGQWVRIACKTLGSGEYHPFTLTSAPHEDHLSLHIRAVGPWTTNIRHTYDPNTVREHPYPKLYLDGPYGEGHQDWYQFEVSVLVGGGIGVTPFASILKDIVNRANTNARFPCKKVYFIWITRTQKHYEWLCDIIREVEEKDTTDLVSTHIFITQFYQKFDLRTTMLYICERHFQKIANRSLFTGLQSTTHFGRPDLPSFFNALQDEHPEVSKVGVFSCGPPGMTNGVDSACSEMNKFDGAAFIHHFENF